MRPSGANRGFAENLATDRRTETFLRAALWIFNFKIKLDAKSFIIAVLYLHTFSKLELDFYNKEHSKTSPKVEIETSSEVAAISLEPPQKGTRHIGDSLDRRLKLKTLLSVFHV